MGLTDLLSDVYSALTFAEAHAEAPADDNESDENGNDESEGEGGEEKPKEGEEGEEEGGGDDDAGDEEEEEEEEEPEDLKPKLEEECAKSAQCAPLKHHYDSCVERVNEQHEDPNHKGPKENCVEECKSYAPSLPAFLCLLPPFLSFGPLPFNSVDVGGNDDVLLLVDDVRLTTGMWMWTNSFPPLALCDAVCCAETVSRPQVDIKAVSRPTRDRTSVIHPEDW
ncbi:MAG: ubiquinol--cytochrome-c reductase subunit 6 [Pleopsidium flavum]|nr:MAG: ubiquinol--cytochrome-c reductase subunit 6 [Pleopsidium flavum]